MAIDNTFVLSSTYLNDYLDSAVSRLEDVLFTIKNSDPSSSTPSTDDSGNKVVTEVHSSGTAVATFSGKSLIQLEFTPSSASYVTYTLKGKATVNDSKFINGEVNHITITDATVTPNLVIEIDGKLVLDGLDLGVANNENGGFTAKMDKNYISHLKITDTTSNPDKYIEVFGKFGGSGTNSLVGKITDIIYFDGATYQVKSGLEIDLADSTTIADQMIGSTSSVTPPVIWHGDESKSSNDKYTDLEGVAQKILAGYGNDNINAGEGDDDVSGGEGNDTLNGGAGNDTLDGGAGNDKLVGGLDDDTYIISANANGKPDVVTEKAGELEGTADEVRSSMTYTLTKNVEVLTLTGTGNISGTGNKGDNFIYGNTGDNVLNGKEGADNLTGGGGNDTFVFDTKITPKADADGILVNANLDNIVDFGAGDIINLKKAIFKGLATDATDTNATDGLNLDSSSFVNGSVANAEKAQILYDVATGNLYYDADGSKADGKEAVLFAVLDNKYASLAASDIHIV